VSERICLRCDWTGGRDGAACPRCGAALYRTPEPTVPREVTPPPRPQPEPTGDRTRSSPIESAQDEIVPAVPVVAARRRWALIVGAIAVAAVWTVASGWPFGHLQTPAVPGPAETGPAVSNCVVTRCTETGPTPPTPTAPEPDYLIDLNTGEMTQLPKSIAHEGLYGVGYAASPDGTMVAYVSDDDEGRRNVFIASLDGTDVQQVTHDQRGAVDPDWSPDGTAIVYTSHDATQRPVPPMPLDYPTAELYMRAADGTGTPTRLTTNTEEERAPNWSHHGDRIAYMCHAGSPLFEICVMHADGSNQTQLTDNDIGDLTTAWSPDDDRIFFHRPMPEPGTPFVRNQLWWVAADGSTEQILVPSSAPTGSTLFADVGVLRVKTGT